MQFATLVLLAAVLIAYGLEMAALVLNRRALSPTLPPEFADVYDADRYRTSQEYTRAGQVLTGARDTFMTLVLVLAILLGWLKGLDAAVNALGLGPISTGLVFFGALMAARGALALPFEVYDTFVLEERYGFNKATWKTFAADRVKGLLLGVALGGPLLAAVLWFFSALGSWAWLTALAVVAVVSLVLQAIGPRYLLPLFNTFTPLPDGGLKDDIQAYAQAQDLTVEGIYVVDGSRRSTKANAFFAGLGGTKRIGLYDTLVDNHTPAEIVAVLAHEAGHAKLGHIRRMFVASMVSTGLYLGLLQLFIHSPWASQALGMQPSLHGAMLGFGILFSPLSLAVGALSGALSRLHERQADAFAARTTGQPQALAAALKRLAVDSMANLTPHPLSVALYYSHPPLLERVRALKE